MGNIHARTTMKVKKKLLHVTLLARPQKIRGNKRRARSSPSMSGKQQLKDRNLGANSSPGLNRIPAHNKSTDCLSSTAQLHHRTQQIPKGDGGGEANLMELHSATCIHRTYTCAIAHKVLRQILCGFGMLSANFTLTSDSP